MTDEAMDLARRAVVCRPWRLMDGMMLASGSRCHTSDHVPYGVPGTIRCDDSDVYGWGPVPEDALPDLTDPATIGCLLAMVREAWGDPMIGGPEGDPNDGNGDVWSMSIVAHYVDGSYEVHDFNGPTEAAALIAALEAAP